MYASIRGIPLYSRLFALAVLLATHCSPAYAQLATPVDNPFPSGIVGRVYDPASQEVRDIASILAIASWHNYLYVALRDIDGNQQIDVWDTKNPSAPFLVDTLDFGTLDENVGAFLPVALAPFDGVLVIEVNRMLRTYRHGADGRLVFLQEFDLSTELGAAGMRQLSVGGNFGSHSQEVGLLSDGLPLELLNQEAIINFTDPTEPFMVRNSEGLGRTRVLSSIYPIDDVFQGEPASLDVEGNQATFVTFRQELESHLNTFWDGKLSAIFPAGALNTSLGSLIDQAIATLDLSALFAGALADYQQQLALGDMSLAELIRGQHADAELLADVLESYGISLDEPVGLAYAKIAAQGFTEVLEANIAENLYGPTLEAWFDGILSVDTVGLTLGAVEASISTLFNAELSAPGGIATYLTRTIISPMLGDPAFLSLTLDEFIDGFAGSDAGAALDVALGITDFGDPLDLLNDILGAFGYLPGVDPPSLPACADLPGSTRQLMDMALFLNSAGLDADGLAWFELLKFYFYLQGGDNLGDYLADVDAQLRSLHEALASDLFENLSGVLGELTNLTESLQDAIGNFAADMPVRDLIGSALAEIVIEETTGTGVLETMTVREAIEVLGLEVDFRGDPTGTVGEFVTVIEGLESQSGPFIANLDINGILDGAGAKVQFLERRLQKLLKDQIAAAFDISDMDLTLGAALAIFVTDQLDLGGTFGVVVADLLGEILGDQFGGTEFGGFLLGALEAFDGDCIAAWSLTLNAIAALLANPLTDFASLWPLALDVLLTDAYNTGINYFVEQMITVLASDVLGELQGSWPSWTSQLAITATTFELFVEDPKIQRRVRGHFVWENRIGFILTERISQFDRRQFQTTVQIFDPTDRAGTLETFDLGEWENVNFVNAAGGAVFISGRHFIDDEEVFPSAKAMVLDVESDPVRIQHVLGTDASRLVAVEGLTAANDGALLAVIALDEIILLPNSVGATLPSPAPDAPNPVATQGDFDAFTRITWDAVAGATGYRVFRSDDDDSANTVALTDWINTTSYDDDTGVDLQPYYYFVKSRNDERESALSASALGWRGQVPLNVLAPMNVEATDGSWLNFIGVIWSYPDGDFEFQVYRSKDENSDNAFARSDWISDHEFDDPSEPITNEQPPTEFYYFVKAREAATESPYSDFDIGYVGDGVIPDTAEDLFATDGTFTDRVRITWHFPVGGVEFQVWRSLDSDPDNSLPISGWFVDTAYDDFTAQAADVELHPFFYFVKARFTGVQDVTGKLSEGDEGWRGTDAEIPALATNVQATQGDWPDRVRVVWEHDMAEVEFQVYRGDSSDIGDMLAVSDWIDLSSYDDFTALGPQLSAGCDDESENVIYYYRVVTRNAAGESGFSEAASGYRGVASKIAGFGASILMLLAMVLGASVKTPAIGRSLPPTRNGC